MRITYLHQYFIGLDRPGITRSYQTARRLAARGHEVNVITGSGGMGAKGGWTVERMDGFTVHRLANPYDNRMSFWRRVRSFLRFALASSLRAASIPADVVFATSTPLTIAIPGVFAKRCRRVPMVFEVRDLWPEAPISLGVLHNPVLVWAARALEQFAYRNSAEIIALSPGMKEGVARAGYPPERIHLISNGCDLDMFQNPAVLGEEWRALHPEIGDRPVVLYGGALGRANRVSWLAQLAAATGALDPRVCFVVIGDGGEKGDVRRAAMEFGVLDRNFFIMSPVPKLEMAAVQSASMMSMVVLEDNPILWTSSPNKFFDALAAGRPVSVNYGGWQADLIEEHGLGLVLPVSDVPRAARSLVAFLSDPGRVESAGRAAGALAERDFSRDMLVDRVASVLEGVVGQTGSRSSRRRGR